VVLQHPMVEFLTLLVHASAAAPFDRRPATSSRAYDSGDPFFKRETLRSAVELVEQTGENAVGSDRAAPSHVALPLDWRD
jgi:hypothetical protein